MKKLFLFCALNCAIHTISAQPGSDSLKGDITRSIYPLTLQAAVPSNTEHDKSLSAIHAIPEGDIIFSVKSVIAPHSASDAQIIANARMRLTGDGKLILASRTVAIDAARPASLDFSSDKYNLFVEKGILTERLRIAVKDSKDWADFVFDNQYVLMPLKELEAFISKEQHLPGIPTTKTVLQDGVDVGVMQAMLLQKIEELTRYIIIQQKEIDTLKSSVQINTPRP